MLHSDWSELGLIFLDDWLVRIVKFLGKMKPESRIADSGEFFFHQVAPKCDLILAS